MRYWIPRELYFTNIQYFMSRLYQVINLTAWLDSCLSLKERIIEYDVRRIQIKNTFYALSIIQNQVFKLKTHYSIP